MRATSRGVTLVLALSGDEETAMKTTQMLARELSNAEMVLNVDGSGGQLDPQGKPQYFTWSGAEKTYADFELTVTSPGGPQLAAIRSQCH